MRDSSADGVNTLIDDLNLLRLITHQGYNRVQSLQWPSAIDEIGDIYKQWKK